MSPDERRVVTLIPGDGIGSEITESVQDIFSAVGVPIDWELGEAGMTALAKSPSGITPGTLESIRRNKVALKGPTTTPIGGGHKSVNVTIRKSLDLFANVRPAISLPAVDSRYENVDLMVVRENIEDTYGGIEHWQSPDVAQGLRIISRTGSTAVVRYALEMARQMGRERVTCVHKANIHKLTDGLFLDTFRSIAQEYSEIETDDILIDNLCMQLVRRPEQFDVLVLPNLFGDIVSDLCAGLVGGLGVAPSANIGYDRAVFEAVHGSAPDIAGKSVANPTALLLSAVQMLRYLGLHDQANDIETALRLALLSGIKTRDLGGHATTVEFTRVVINALPRRERYPKSHETHSSKRPVVPRIASSSQSPDGDRGWNLCGVDVFVKSDELPALPASFGNLKLDSIANRGTQVFPGEPLDITLVDWFAARYLTDGPLAEETIWGLLVEISKVCPWVQVEKLHRSGEKDLFSAVSS